MNVRKSWNQRIQINHISLCNMKNDVCRSLTHYYSAVKCKAGYYERIENELKSSRNFFFDRNDYFNLAAIYRGRDPYWIMNHVAICRDPRSISNPIKREGWKNRMVFDFRSRKVSHEFKRYCDIYGYCRFLHTYKEKYTRYLVGWIWIQRMLDVDPDS